MSTNKCSKTITARLARTKLFSEQLISMSLFILQLIKQILEIHIKENELPLSQKVSDWRLLIISIRSNLVTYNTFYNKICERFKHVSEIILLAVEAHAFLVGLEDDISPLNDPVHTLWLYVLKIMYISPFMVMREDDEQGLAVKTFNKSLKKFVPQIINIKFNRNHLSKEDLPASNETENDDDYVLKEQNKIYEQLLPAMKIQI
jgi:hypothetical protein